MSGDCASTAKAACTILAQCSAFLRAVPDGAYAKPSSRTFGSTIGQHVRHSLDHFEAVCSGLDGRAIVYDHRERGTSIETSRQAALDMIARVSDRLAGVSAGMASRPVRVEVMLSASGDEATLASTLGRELAFAAHHAIHHHAMMASLGEEMGVALTPGFGQAPSTLAHESCGGKC